MSQDDKYPTIRQIMDGDAPFPEQAFDNDQGMRVLADPKEDHDMVKDGRSGLFLPKPTQKQVTQLCFDTGLTLTVSETYDEVCETLRELPEGMFAVFTAPVFNDPVRIEWHAIQKLMAITVEYRDLKELETAEKQRELNLRLTEAQMAQQRVALLNQQRHANRRNR
jgi:hypothetical protein